MNGQAAGAVDPAQPASYPRRILVASLGLAPQVLTETIYYLAVLRSPPFVPSEIHVVTTAEGAHRARVTLLHPDSAKLAKLAEEYAIEGLGEAFDEDRIHIIADAGEPLADINCETDNEAAADLITDLLRTLTSDDNAAVHVSIAGGRKTMGFLLGYATSLFARPQDRLSHVLVSAPFENHPQFFFPPKRPQVLRDRDGRPVSTADARLMLADIPLIRLRRHLPDTLLAEGATYSQTVAQAQRQLDTPDLVIDVPGQQVICQGTPVGLSPLSLALMAWLARRAKSGAGDARRVRWDRDDWSEWANLYERLRKTHRDGPSRLTELAANADDVAGRKAFFEERLSRLRSELRKTLGELAPAYEPSTRGARARATVGIDLPPGAIVIVEG